MKEPVPNGDGRATARLRQRARRYVDALSAWESAKPRRAGHAVYRAYSQLFIPFAILVLIGLPVSGREIIWNIDGLSQYYAFFVYEGEWIRGVITGLFSGNGLSIPLWEWHSGYGVDVPTTFDTFLDPLNLVSAITPPSLSEWVFQLLIVLRLYLAGLAFAFYGATRGENRTGIVLGALLYALCGWGLVAVRWTSGLHAFVLFPFILAGAERVLAGRKPWVFIASLTLLVIVSYYFAYMAVILLVGYLAVRVVMVERPNLTVGKFLRWVAVFAALSILCAILAAFVLVPAAIALMGMDRFVDSSTTMPLLYAPSYYIGLLSSFLSVTNVGSDSYIGFGGLAFFSCIALFSQRGKNTQLKLVFVVLTVIFLIPFAGSVMNGMNYATNRWAWAYALCVAFVLARMTPTLMAIDARGKRIMVASAIAYAVLFIIPAFRTEANMAGYAALLAVLMVLLVVQGVEMRRCLMTCGLALTLAVSGFYFLAASENGMGKEQVPLGAAYTKLSSGSVGSIAQEVEDGSWWRYDAAQVSYLAHSPMNRIPNNSLVLGLNGIDFYNSVYDDNIDRFHTELAIAGDNINFRYTNLQGRADVMALLGVKYYAMRNDGTDAAPYGFNPANEAARRNIAGVDYSLVAADAPLSIGYVFEKALSREDYEALAPIQRQQALLQAVVLEGEGGATGGDSGSRDAASGNSGSRDAAANSISSAAADAQAGAQLVKSSQLTFEDSAVPFTIAASNGVEVQDGCFLVHAPGATVTLECQGVPRADTYLYFRGLKLTGVKPSDLLSAEFKASKPWYYRVSWLVEDLSYAAPSNYELAIKSDASSMTGYIYNDAPTQHMYGGKDTWLVELGYSDQPVHAITVTFDTPGAYNFEDMQVLAETHDQQAAWVADRAQSSLENVNLGRNQLTGTVDLDQPGTLLITTAHGDGWTAFVDGQPADLLRADTAFMGLNLTAGHHDIDLRYRTPGLMAGLAVTAAGVVMLVVLIVVLRRRDAARQTGNGETPGKEAPARENADPEEGHHQ